MSTVHDVQQGDTLCTLAINNGFKDCKILRAMKENAAFLNRPLRPGDKVTLPDLNVSDNPSGSDDTHKFTIKQRDVDIRFVHGTPNLPYDQDPDRNVLNVSNFTTTLCGATEAAALPSASNPHFDANADADGDAFKVEVLDSRPPGADLEVVVEPLKPVYTAGGDLSGHEPFDGDPHDKGTTCGNRSLVGKAHKVTAKRFRTGYLRLVVDDIDQDSRPEQTVMVTDDVINGNSQMEILDQDIRATYVLSDCPATPDTSKCRVEKTASLNRGQFVDLALHIVRATPTGVVETTPGGPGDDGIVKLKDLQDCVNQYCRRRWAQDLVKFKIVSQQTVDLPSDMLTVSDSKGNRAFGFDSTGTSPGKVGFTMRVQHFDGSPDSVHGILPIPVNAGDTPEQTAGNIQSAINAVPGFSAAVSVNPAEVGRPLGSADILITEASGGHVTIESLTQLVEQDQDQWVSFAHMRTDLSVLMSPRNYHVGHPEERNLIKTLDTGDDRIDVIVVASYTNHDDLLGHTKCRQSDVNPIHQTLPEIRNTVTIRRVAADGTSGKTSTLPHEIGHALLDCALHADSTRQLMFERLNENDNVNDARRLIAIDPPAVNWTNVISSPDGKVGTQRIRMNTLTRLMDKASGLLHS